MSSPTQTQSWKRLENLSNNSFQISKTTERILELDGLVFDYSKQRITDEVLETLIELADEQNFFEMRQSLFQGDEINTSDKRAALHTACRAKTNFTESGQEAEAIKSSQKSLQKMKDFVSDIRSGKHTGYSGQKITDVVNIGVGGSDLGPRMVTKALSHLITDINVHFVANIDESDVSQTLLNCSPETTLFLIASKSFGTQETLFNAETAKKWFLAKTSNADLSSHFAALSVNKDAANDFGVADRSHFYSYW